MYGDALALGLVTVAGPILGRTWFLYFSTVVKEVTKIPLARSEVRSPLTSCVGFPWKGE